MTFSTDKKQLSNRILSQMDSEKRRRVRKLSKELEDSSTEVLMEYTTPGTFSNIERPDPDLYPNCEIVLVGGGGAGASGRRGSTTTICRGGGGGGGGALAARRILTSNISPTFSVVVGAGGTGGASATVDDTDGNPGTVGGNTSFNGTFQLTAAGGNFGGAGTATAGNGGSSQPNLYFSESSSGLSGGTSNSTGAGAVLTPSTLRVTNGGASGGSLQANNTTEYLGGFTTGFYITEFTTLPGDPAGNKNGRDGSLITLYTETYLSQGGSGGASKVSEAAGRGGNGIRGSGGGGGGASRNGFASGAGGNGGDGYVFLRFYA